MRINDISNLISSIADNSQNTASKVRNVLTAIQNEVWVLNEVKDIALSTSAISSYFDSTGLGKPNTLYDGFAICNGQNSTWNLQGRVSIGYDNSNYPTVGASGGSADAVLVSHSHTYDTGQESFQAGTNHNAASNSGSLPSHIKSTSVEGESGIGKNMPPYIVMLKIQRIA